MHWSNDFFEIMASGTKALLQKENLLHSCAHHIDDRVVIIQLAILENSIEVKCKIATLWASPLFYSAFFSRVGMEYRQYQIWTQPISFCVVSAMIQRYHGQLPILWDMICRSMQFSLDDWEVHCDTQHITPLPAVSNSLGKRAYHVFEVQHYLWCSNVSIIFTASYSLIRPRAVVL
jgi:hypothetical protein